MTTADLAIVGIMLISGALALMRGFVREVFSIVSWAGAAFITLWLFPPLEPTGQRVLGFMPTVWREVTTGVSISLVALIALSYLTTKATEKLRGEKPGPWDGTAGFIFGIARGFIVVCLLYLFYGWVEQPKADPPWIAKAKFLPLIKKTDDVFLKLIAKAEVKIPQNHAPAGSSQSYGYGKKKHKSWWSRIF